MRSRNKKIPIAEKFCRRIAAAASIFALLLCSNLCVKPQEISAPPQVHQWGAITLFNGLPSDNVRGVAQTPDGILWLATDAGLAKFDGRLIENVSLEKLPSSKILTIAVGVAGEIWLGTEQGAARIVDGKVFFVDETSGKPITSILTGEITTLVGGDKVFSIHHNPDNSLEVITDDAPNFQLYTSARNNNGEVVFGSKGRGLVTKENDFQEVISRPRPFFINALKSDAKGNILIGAQAANNSAGLFTTQNFSNLTPFGSDTGTVNSIEPTDDGDVWVGTENNGLFHFRADGVELAHYTFDNTAGGLRSNKIYTIFSDREKVLWLGTNRGVCRFDPSSPFNQTLSTDGNSNFVRTIYRTNDGAQIFAGTNRGLFSLVDNQWIAANSFNAKTIYAVGEDANNQLLIGTALGVYGFDGKQILSGDTRAIAGFQGKTYAAIFGRGVVRLDDQTPIFDDNSPTTIYSDGEKLWIGTAQNGVFVYDGKNISQPSQFENLRGAAVRKIIKDRQDNLWLSGERGLFVSRQGGDLQIVLADQDVRDVALIGDDVWATTLKNGLVHLREDENFGWLASDLNVEQGLPSEQIFSILPLENRFLIGTNRGIVGYAPSAVAPQIILVRVISQKLYEPQEIADEIKLEYPQNSLLVEVAGISSRTFPEQFQYSFFLKNSKGEIIDKRLSNQSQFSAANLSAGEYEIEARSFNKDLLVSAPLTIKFSVARAPFPWTATWLGILLTIALIALIWAIFERRRIRQRNRELAAARFDLANEAERERKRIARDLHDQTLADLRQLMLESDKLPKGTTKFRLEIEAVSTEIRRICEDLSPSVLENVGLAPALEFLLSHSFTNWEFKSAEQIEEKISFKPNEQMQIYRIAQEVLNNIKRHSQATKVQMEIELSGNNEFVLRITDDGKFFSPPENSAQGQRGIVNIKSRAALINAETDWQKSCDDGTIFTLKKHLE